MLIPNLTLIFALNDFFCKFLEPIFIPAWKKYAARSKVSLDTCWSDDKYQAVLDFCLQTTDRMQVVDKHAIFLITR